MMCAKTCLSSLPTVGIMWCNDMPLGRCWESNDRRKGIKIPLTTVIPCRAFMSRFWEEGQCKPQTNGPVWFASLRSIVISFVFLFGWGKWLAWKKSVGTWEQLPPSKCVKKPWFQK